MATPDVVTANLLFAIRPPEGVRAWQSSSANPTTGERDKNWAREEKPMQIENVRDDVHSVTLDTAGFQFYLDRPAKHRSFTDDADIEREYYPESVDLIKELTGASRVVIFDHTIRRRLPGQNDDNPSKRQPVSQAHVDQSTASSIARVHRHLPPADAPALLRRRFQIINFWRPINHPADDWPLALCDYRSVDPKADTFPIALVFPDREGETLGVTYNPNQKWKYVRGMTPDDIVLIKCFDSIQDGSVAVFTPHTGFRDPATPPDAPPRQSIELRALVFYD